LAGLLQSTAQHDKAVEVLKNALQASPAATPLIAPMLATSALACGQGAQALTLLQGAYEAAPCLDVLEAMVTLHATQGEQASAQARDLYVRHLEKEPSLVAAAKWIAGEKLEHEQFHPQVQRALDHAVKPLTRYRCAACGFEAQQHFWHCPGCQAWDSYPARRVEEL
jgi:lipopolysaccharide biosynthesis regulator YciM